MAKRKKKGAVNSAPQVDKSELVVKDDVVVEAETKTVEPKAKASDSVTVVSSYSNTILLNDGVKIVPVNPTEISSKHLENGFLKGLIDNGSLKVVD